MRWPATGGTLRSTKLCWNRTELCCHTENRSSILGRNWPAKRFRSESDIARVLRSGPCACGEKIHANKIPIPAYEGMGIAAARSSNHALRLFAARLGWEVLEQLVHRVVQVFVVLVG